MTLHQKWSRKKWLRTSRTITSVARCCLTPLDLWSSWVGRVTMISSRVLGTMATVAMGERHLSTNLSMVDGEGM